VEEKNVSTRNELSHGCVGCAEVPGTALKLRGSLLIAGRDVEAALWHTILLLNEFSGLLAIRTSTPEHRHFTSL